MKTYYKHLRKKNNTPYATFCALIPDSDHGPAQFGWSLCNPKDQFEKKKGRMIATGRALSERHNAGIPHAIYKQYVDYMHKVTRKLAARKAS